MDRPEHGWFDPGGIRADSVDHRVGERTHPVRGDRKSTANWALPFLTTPTVPAGDLS